GLVEIPNQRRVGPRLIRGMRDLSPRAVDHGRDAGILPGRLDLRPLLELDDHRVLVSVGIAARQDEVDALRGERNPVLDGYTLRPPGCRNPRGRCSCTASSSSRTRPRAWTWRGPGVARRRRESCLR